jgi:predicted HTH domain antitoxin
MSKSIGGSMAKQNVQIDVPKEVRGKVRQEYLATTRELLKEQTILRLFEAGKVSAGYASNLLGLDRHAFNELLAKHRLSPFNSTPDELDREFKVIGELAKKLKSHRKKVK